MMISFVQTYLNILVLLDLSASSLRTIISSKVYFVYKIAILSPIIAIGHTYHDIVSDYFRLRGRNIDDPAWRYSSKAIKALLAPSRTLIM